MKENIRNLLFLIEQNPNLPLVPMVDAEICGDDYGTYMGGWGNARIDEYIVSSKDNLVLFKSDDDVFDVLERCLSRSEFEALPESEDECRAIYKSLPWKKAIIVDIVNLNEE